MPQRLQIHDVPDELMAAMKKRAIDEKKHLRAWVIDSLSGLVQAGKYPFTSYPSARNDSDSLMAGIEEPDPFQGRTAAEQLAHDVINHGLPKEVDRVDIYAGRDNPVKVASVPVGKHDPEKCRIYGCLQCKAAEKKISTR